MPPNERLRAALLERGLTPARLAEVVGVDAKTVERWITQGRVPYRRLRYAASSHLGLDETYLWPGALKDEQVTAVSASEVITIYPHRYAVPRDLMGRLFSEAREQIGVLVYSGLFLAEDYGIHQILIDRAKAGVRVRFLLGDPDSPQVAERGADEGIDSAMAAKIRNVIVNYRRLRVVENVEFRLHSTVLYNSIFRIDDQLLINTHVYGVPASQAPFWHLRKLAGGEIVNTYLDSFERVWEGAKPLPPEG
jgi:transcriptional regulator with XRE-family HTH domain